MSMLMEQPTLPIAPSAPLASNEAVELANHEGVIEKGRKAFLEVGNALACIRDKHLYRASHATFEAYCLERWQFSRYYAHRLMGAVEITKDLLPIGNKLPDNEAQVRELAAAPAELRSQVWREAVETAPAGKVTAGHVRQVALKIAPPPLRVPAPAPPPAPVVAQAPPPVADERREFTEPPDYDPLSEPVFSRASAVYLGLQQIVETELTPEQFIAGVCDSGDLLKDTCGLIFRVMPLLRGILAGGGK